MDGLLRPILVGTGAAQIVAKESGIDPSVPG
jgi:hypothetical protein